MEEISVWSVHHPGHLPLIVLLELKNDWMILDPALSDFAAKELQELDQLLKSTFGNRLFTPSCVIGSHPTLKEAITEDGWPLLLDTLGKTIFLLHPGKYTETYVSLDPDFDTMAMFPAAENNDINNSYASFIVHNIPDVGEIQKLVRSNFIVRTRIDEKLVIDPEALLSGMESGAQILSTDFHPAHQFAGIAKIYLSDRYTVIHDRKDSF